MQYLPISFAVFQVFLPTGLVIYYISQTILRIGQQHYITKRFYHGEGSLGKQAQEASARARELHKNDKNDKGATSLPAKGAPAKGTPSKGSSAPAKSTPAKGAVSNRPEPKKNQGRPLPTKNQRPAPSNTSSNQKASAGPSSSSGGSNQKGSTPQRNGSSAAGGQKPASRHPKPTKKK
jgi:hypothetical protein